MFSVHDPSTRPALPRRLVALGDVPVRILVVGLLFLVLAGLIPAETRAAVLSVQDSAWPLDARAAFHVSPGAASGLSTLVWTVRVSQDKESGSAGYQLAVYAPGPNCPGELLFQGALSRVKTTALGPDRYQYSAGLPSGAPRDLADRWIVIQRIGPTLPEWSVEEIQAPVTLPGGSFLCPELGAFRWTGISDDAASETAAVDQGVPAAPAPGTRTMDFSVTVSPNPTPSTLQLRITSPSASSVSLRLLDVSGRLLSDGGVRQVDSGVSSLTWRPAERLSSGVYFVEARIRNVPACHTRIVVMP